MSCTKVGGYNSSLDGLDVQNHSIQVSLACVNLCKNAIKPYRRSRCGNDLNKRIH